jgi:uncharacterized protein (TIGR02145 family)
MLIMVLAISCEEKSEKTSEKANEQASVGGEVKAVEVNPNEQTFLYAFNFKATVEKSEDFDDLKTYTNFKLKRDNSLIYHDTSLTEYTFENQLFPIILQTGDHSFELLFEVEGRPGRNYLKRFFVTSNIMLAGQDKLPGFIGEPEDINNDGIKEYAGYWGLTDLGGPDESGILYTGYNPTLYYSVTKTGLKLDSLLTREQHEREYGQFYGFEFDAHRNIPTTLTYEGQQYKVVKIGSQTWMAENLNYNAKGSKCYGNKPENCSEYGRLYNWETAKAVCRHGWHLPSDAEWDVLMRYVQTNKNTQNLNEYGFAALPDGYWWSSSEADCPDVCEDGHPYAKYRQINSNSSFSGDEYGKAMEDLLSVRCVKD